VTRKLNKILPNLGKNWPKIQNIIIKAKFVRFVSPKHPFQTTFKTLKYLQQIIYVETVCLGENWLGKK
jgi:hypothetical protein